MKPIAALRSFLLGSLVFSASPVLHAAIYYWDDNAVGADFGTAGASTGTWAGPTAGPTAGWSLSGTGANAFASFTTVASGTADALNFGTNTVGLGLGAGTITVSGAVSANTITYGSQSGAILLSGGTSLTLGGTTPTITVNNAQNTISTKLLGSAGLIKAGSGELVLDGTANSFSGDASGTNGVTIRVSAGTLTVSGGSLSTTTAAKGLGTFSGDTGAFNQTGGTVATLGDLIVGWNSGPTFTLSGGLTTAANIRHQDANSGTITISGTNTTTVGAVTHTASGIGPDSLTVNLNTGGTLAANSLGLSLSGSALTTGNHSLNVNFDGGTLKARTTGNLIAATPTGTSTRAINVIVKTNGAIFDSNGFTATILQPVLHDSVLGPSPDGGLTLNDTAVTKGTLVLTGANTYTGPTTITAGTLQFPKQTTLYSNITTDWTAANIRVAATGVLALNVGGTGEFTTGNVTSLLTDLGGANGTSTTGFAAGSFIAFDTTNAALGTFTVADILADSTGSGGGAIGLKKLGPNTLVLSGPNTYSGATVVSGGTLVLGNLGAIANSASVSVATGTTLQANLAGTYANTAAVSLTGPGTNILTSGLPGALHFGNGGILTSVWNAPLTLGNANTRITSFGATMNQTLGAAIGGTGPLELSSRGGASASHLATWTLNAASNYTGATAIVNNDGIKDITVKLGILNALPATTSLNLSAVTGTANAVFATLDLNGFSQTLAGLTDTGGSAAVSGTSNKRVINSSGTLATLAINNAGAVAYGTTGTRITAGTIGGTTAGGVAANNLALTKSGAGTLTLSGTNTYTGGTTVTSGTLTLGSASALGSAAANITGGSLNLGGQTIANSISIGASGTLTGSGSTGAATLAGTVTPGGSGSGLVTMASATVDPTTAIALQLAATGTRGVNYDALTFTSALSLDGTITVTLNGLTPAGGQSFDLINSTGSIDLTNFNVATDLILPSLGGGLVWDTSAFGSTGVVSISSGGDPYAAWAGAAVFDQDDNNDGVDNGVAWFLGAGSPTENATGRLPVVTQSGGNLELSFTCLKVAGRGTAVLKLQYSRDLGITDLWTSHEVSVPDAAGPVGSVTFTVPTVNGDPDLVDLKASIPASEAAPGTKLFARIVAVR